MRSLCVVLSVALLACGREPRNGASGPGPAEGADPGAPPTPPASDGPSSSQPLLGSCWANAPQGGSIEAVWATSTRNAWVVGSPAFALHWDGRAWARPPLAASRSVTSVWSSDGGNAWMTTSDGTVLRGDSRGLQEALPAGSAAGWVRGHGEDDVWAGEQHWDGAQWTRHAIGSEPLPAFGRNTRIVPLGDGTAFAIFSPPPSGAFRACARFDGSSWAPEPCPHTASLQDGSLPVLPWSSGAGDLWVAGLTLGPPPLYADFGLPIGQWLSRWDGRRWSSEGLPTTTTRTQPVLTGTGTGDVWFGAPDFHLEGTSWARVSPPEDAVIDAVAVPGALLAADRGGVVSIRDAQGSRPLLDLGPPLVAGSVGAERMGAAVDRIVRFDGGRWTSVADADAEFLRPIAADLNARLFGSAAEDLWITHYAAGAHRWDGRHWSTVTYPGVGRFASAGGAVRGRTWLAGEENLQIGTVTTGARPLWVREGEALARVAELGADDVSDVLTLPSGETFAFATRRLGPGYGPWAKALWRHDGSGWVEVWSAPTPGPYPWWPVHGATEPDDVWAIADVSPSGGPGAREIWHWDGVAMQRVGPLRAGDGVVTTVVRRGEMWLSTRHWPEGPTTFRAVTLAGIAADDVATLPALARDIWVGPDGSVQALTDAGAVWFVGQGCGVAGP